MHFIQYSFRIVEIAFLGIEIREIVYYVVCRLRIVYSFGSYQPNFSMT